MKNIHLLPTDKPSRLYKLNVKNEFFLHPSPIQKDFYMKSALGQHIYITSDEEIKKGDWCIEFTPNSEKITELFKCNEEQVLNISTGTDYKYKKVILTTHPDLIKDGVQAINDEFLEWFVKNPSCEWVEVKLLEYGFDEVPICKYEIIIPNIEIWKDIPEFEGYYQVSNLGNVKSLSRIILGRGKHNTLLKERLLKFSTSTNGYYQVILQKEGFKKNI